MKIYKFTDRGILNGVQVSCSVRIDQIEKKLKYKIQTSHKNFQPPQNADWALLGLIYPAMMLGQDLFIDAPISKNLLFYAQNDLQILLKSVHKKLTTIKIHAKSIPENKLNKIITATGFSGGVDTFASLAINSKMKAPEKISNLTLFNVGAFGKNKSIETHQLINDSFLQLKRYSKLTSNDWFFVDTNLEDFYYNLHNSGFEKTHTLRNASAALSLQSKISNYFYSSGTKYSAVSTVESKFIYPSTDISFIDPILLPLISTANMKFTSYGACYSRFEKIEIISKFEPAYDFLNVCIGKPIKRLQSKNCSICVKCIRTILSLEILGKLDKFSHRFELDKYNKHKKNYIRKIGLSHIYGNNNDVELHAKLKGLSMIINPRFSDYIKLHKYYLKKILNKRK